MGRSTEYQTVFPHGESWYHSSMEHTLLTGAGRALNPTIPHYQPAPLFHVALLGMLAMTSSSQVSSIQDLHLPVRIYVPNKDCLALHFLYTSQTFLQLSIFLFFLRFYIHVYS